jgi:hypothetical protein
MRERVSPRKMLLMSHCGLYCADCPGHSRRIADLASRLQQELDRASFEPSARMLSGQPGMEALKQYDKGRRVIDALTRIRCSAPCRTRLKAGRLCEIQACCRDREFEGCWECTEFARCSKLRQREVNHGDAHIRNIRAIRRDGVKAFIDSGRRLWYATPRRKRRPPTESGR